jgi:hypothetical protein
MFHLAPVVLMLVHVKVMFAGRKGSAVNYMFNEAHNHIHHVILLGLLDE